MNTDIYILLEDYLDGLLSADETKQLEQRLSEDAELKQELELLRQTRAFGAYQAQHGAGDEALAQTLGKLGKQYFTDTSAAEPTPGSVWRRRLLFLAAASAVILLILVVPRFFNRGDLFEEYAGYPAAGFALKSAGTSDAQTLADAEERFNRKDYSGAATALRTFLSAHPNEPEQRFYLGLCLLKQDQVGEAKTIFQALSTGGTTYAGDGRWYLALAFLKEGDLQSSKNVLQSIPEQDPYREKAAQLLQKIGKRLH